MRLTVGTMAIAMAALTPVRAHGQQAGTITVWTDANFRGPSATLRGATPDLRPYGLNNAISSLRILPGQAWEVCEQPNFRGRCQVVSGDVRDLGKATSWNDRISSLRPVRRAVAAGAVVGPPRQLVLYGQINFGGPSYAVSGPMAQTGTVVTRSARAQGTWLVCDGRQFTGRCQVVSGSVTDVRTVGLNRIQSARPQ
jgi:Beta/Gamma crystallin